MKRFALLPIGVLALCLNSFSQNEDPYLWLEEVDEKKALEFVNQQNKLTVEKLSQQKEYQSIFTKTLEIYNSTDRIVYPNILGGYIYNFWQDKDHARGIWRRTLKSSTSVVTLRGKHYWTLMPWQRPIV